MRYALVTRLNPRRLTVGLGTVLMALGLVSAFAPGTATADPAVAVGAAATLTIDGHGNGHGHGMSQYGARGAARRGLTAAQITKFYYPGTTLTTMAPSTVRVLIGDDGGATTVLAQPGLFVTGVSTAVGTAGISAYRLVPSGAGLAIQRLIGATWATAKVGLPARADFSSATPITMVHGDGSHSVYRGTIGALRSGAGLLTINRLPLEAYTQGVTPFEMPSSWEAAAVQSQAIAARTYARNAVERNAGSPYDICDSDNCQVYGGMSGESAASNAAVAATANQVLTYNGAAIFAQFSSSNGGWTVAGNQPYLIAQADPYEQYADDPYLNWTRTVPTRQVASYYGLSAISSIQVTARDGHGDLGGRVTAATVTAAGGAVTTTTGYGLQAALGLPESWFRIRPAGRTGPIGVLDVARMTSLHTFTISGWVFDPAKPAASASLHVYIDGVGVWFGASNTSRPDVQRVEKAQTADLGYSLVLPVAGGRHQVCVDALSADQSVRTHLSCQIVTVPVNAMGSLDSVVATAPGVYSLSGWVFDPDSDGGTTQVHVYVDSAGHAFIADGSRPDVLRAYGLANGAVGYSVTVPVPAGRHSVCAYAINDSGAGSNEQVRCVWVTG